MNKLLIFPMALMLILTIFSMFFIDQDTSARTPDIENETVTSDSGDLININSATAVLLILTLALTLGAASGFHLLGSGLTDTSQKMIFNTTLFIGLWACLSIASNSVMFSNIFTSLLWVVLTIMYVIGFGIHVTNAG